MSTYKNSKVKPMVGDIVMQNGIEVQVGNVRLNPKAGFCNCSFDGVLCLDTPWTVEFVRRGELAV